MGVGARGEGERPPTGEEEGGCARGARPGRRGGARCAARRRLAATLAAADGAHAPAWRDGERGERRGRRQRGHVPSWCDRPRDKREVRNIHSRRVAGPVQPQETCFRRATSACGGGRLSWRKGLIDDRALSLEESARQPPEEGRWRITTPSWEWRTPRRRCASPAPRRPPDRPHQHAHTRRLSRPRLVSHPYAHPPPPAAG